MRNKKSNISYLSLTENQKRLWLVQNLMENDPQYNICFCVSLKGPLNIEKVCDSFQIIFNKYNAFKTGFLSVDQAYLAQEVVLPFYYENWTDQQLSLEECYRQELISKLKQLHDIPFNLKTVPLARVHLLQINKDEYLLLFVTHHIVNDAASFSIVMKDFKSLYSSNEKENNKDSNSVCQNNPKDTESCQKFWLNTLKQGCVLDFPIDKIKNNKRPQIMEYIFELDSKMIEQTRQAAKSFNTTTFKFFLTCYAILLHRYTLQDDFIVGVPTHGRISPEDKQQVGFLVKLLPILMSFNKEISFIELVEQITESLNIAVANQDVPYMELLDHLKLTRDAVHDPLFNNYFNIAILDDFCEQESNNIKIDYIWTSSGFTHNLFGIIINRLRERYQISFKYDASVLEFSMVQQLAEHWKNIILSLLKEPRQKVSDVQFFTCNIPESMPKKNRYTQSKKKNLIDVFNEQYALYPNQLAALSENNQLTYNEIHQKSAQLSIHLLNNCGVKKGDVVAILLGHEIDLLVAVLAIIRCGAIYVSIDSHYPLGRINYILNDSNAQVLLTKKYLINKLEQNNMERLITPSLFFIEENKLENCHDNLPSVIINPTDLIYIVYTSGTTGKPKGVKTTHQGLLNVAYSQQNEFQMNEDSRTLQFASVGFDAFASEWASTLCAGATLVFSNQSLVGEELEKIINQFSVTHITLPPSILETLKPQQVTSLKTIVVAGESCTKTIVDIWHSVVRLINAYGPSENSICSTLFLCNPDYPAATIGKNIDQVYTYVLDKYLNIVPQGCIGELHLGGNNLSPGYLNLPELTEKKFINNPFVKNMKNYTKQGTWLNYCQIIISSF